ncbi:hypothetical protein WIS52_02365 [Pseudonocardia nematodicida]|uniref:PhoD-like phosphatase metallophosphatase domain-containing protein n=1 Tax=Pseudonocardia nematodicida TaxID=1206997 RepID=A0ABV1K7J1_9PSEU
MAATPRGSRVPALPSWLRGWRPRTTSLDDGVALVQKNARPEGFDLWIGVVLGPRPDAVPDPLPLTVTMAGQALTREYPVVLRWYRPGEGGSSREPRFFHGHLTVDAVPPGAYDVSVEVPQLAIPGRSRAVARVRTLPRMAEPGDELRLMVGSCYDAGTDSHDEIGKAHARAFPSGTDLTFLLGDQVYADAPFTHYAFRSRRRPRSGLLLKYWTTWGMSTSSDRTGLKRILSGGPNYFLPDDHEFWNGWPNRSVTAKHSIGKISEARRNHRERVRAVVPDDEVSPVPPSPDAGAPTDPFLQSYFPVHPAEWEGWSLASFELFGSFQTRSVADRAGQGPSLGVDDEGVAARAPRRAGPPGIHAPRNEILQTIHIDPLTFCLLDTRTRRTRRLRHPVHSAFVDPVFLDEMLRRARAAAVFVLATPQPLLVRAGHHTQKNTAERLRLFGSETDVQDYWYQWQRLWDGLIDAREGRPTVVLGGDIHRSHVATVPEIGLLEIVSSPMSLVWGGGVLSTWRRLAGLFGGRREDLRLSEIADGPRARRSPLPDARARFEKRLPQDREGFAGVTFTRVEGSALDLEVTLFERRLLVDDVPPGAGTPARPLRFRLDPGRRGTAAVVRL